MLVCVLDRSFAQPASDWKLIGQVGGPVQAVAVAGKYAYVGVGLRLVVLDISNPAAPLEIGSTTPFPYFVHGIAVSGSRACVAGGGGGLHILDLSNPALPVEIGAWTSPGYAESVAVSGNTAYLANGPFGLRVIDISDPTKPREIGRAFETNYAFQVALAGDVALVASGGAGLLVADVSNSSQPRELATVGTPGGYAFGVSAANGTAYVANGWGGVQLVNFADPTHPVVSASCNTPGWALGITVSGGQLFVADGGYGLQILDASTLQSLGAYETPNSIYQAIAVSGKVAYVADRLAGLRILSVADPAIPAAVGSMATLGLALSAAATDTRAFVGTPEGVRIVDLKDPSHPMLAGFFDMPNNIAVRLRTAGEYAIAFGAANNGGMYIIDATDPNHPVQAAYLSTLGHGPFRDLAIDGSLVYIADEWGLEIFDISNPRQPRALGFVRLDDWPGPGNSNSTSNLAVRQGFAYVLAPDGVKIVDVRDPTKPIAVAAYHGSQYCNAGGIRISGDLAYISGGGGMDVHRLTDPLLPTLVFRLPSIGQTVQSSIRGNQLLCADLSLGLGIMDLANPLVPTRLAWVDTPGTAYDIDVSPSGLALVADGEAGLSIFSRNKGQPSPAFVARPAIPIPPATPPFPRPLDASEPRIPALPVTTGKLIVNSALDSGPGTLRDRITSAPVGTLITFDPVVFPVGNPATIQLASALPILRRGGLILDASNAGVVLDGSKAGNVDGLNVESDGNAIMGLRIVQFGRSGIRLQGSGNRIGGNRAQGTGPSGEGNVVGGCENGIFLEGAQVTNNVVLGNLLGIGLRNEPLSNRTGLAFQSASANFIGGATPATRNIISANIQYGINVSGTSHDNVIAGNLIGTTLDGRSSAGVQQDGVFLNAVNNRVGGVTPAERNIVSGNLFRGIELINEFVRGNRIIGNYIGLNVDGDSALPNLWAGMRIEGGATHTLVQGNAFGPAGDSGALFLSDGKTAYNSVVGNSFGTDAAQTRILPGNSALNLGGGFINRAGGTDLQDRNVFAATLAIFAGCHGFVLGNAFGLDRTGTRSLSLSGTAIAVEPGAGRSFVGGLTVAEANLISSGGNAIQVESGNSYVFIGGNTLGFGASGDRNQNGIRLRNTRGTVIQKNIISTNSGSGVLLTGGEQNVIRQNSIFANSGLGIALSSGGNASVLPPTISTATPSAVSGTAATGSQVEVFSDTAGQGRVYEGTATTDATGGFRFIGTQPLRGPNITATATDSNGNTSVFSASRPIASTSTNISPSIILQSGNTAATFGGTAILRVVVTGSPTPSCQWQTSSDQGSSWSAVSDSATYSGAATASLSISGISPSMAGYQYRCVVTNSVSSVTSAPVSLAVQTSSLANLSVLTNVVAGQPLIAGFVASGGSRQVLLRAIGPGLQSFLPGAPLAGNPRLELYDGSSALVQTNDNWGGTSLLAGTFSRLGAFSLANNSLDAALLNDVSGANTVRFLTSVSGKGLLEVYAADSSLTTARLVNLSVLNVAGGGDNVLTIGFVIAGNSATNLLIRGIGPALAQFGVAGVLVDPRLDLYSGPNVVASNNDWSSSANAFQLSGAAAAVGAFALPVGSKDSALLVTLLPGNYTAQVLSGVATSGIALVEVYEVH